MTPSLPLLFAALVALGLPASAAPTPPSAGPSDGLLLPEISQIGDAIVGQALTIQMENTAYSPIEGYLVGFELLPAPVSLGTQGTLFILPSNVFIAGHPSQTTTQSIPPNPGLIGFPLQIQGIGLIIEGAVGEVRLSNLLTVPLLSPAPEALSYPDDPVVYLEEQPITPNTPEVTWKPDLYEISPALPPGLSIDDGTGVISGAASDPSPTTGYLVTASNSQGETSTTVTITVDPKAPTTFTYTESPAFYTTADTVLNEPIIDAFVDSYAVTPELPAGLTLDTATGVISGQPTAITPTTAYVVTASNVTGSIQTTLTISVDPAPPTNLEYSQPYAVYSVGSPITPNVPSVETEVVDSYSVNPPLPAGLSLDTATGVISGAPSSASSPQVLTAYTVTATNVSGSTQAVVHFVVDTLPPPTLIAPAEGGPGANIAYQLNGTLAVMQITEVLAIDVMRDEAPTFVAGLGLVYLDEVSPTYQEIEGDGSHQWSFPVPDEPSLIGTKYYAQATGFVFSGVGGAVRISNVTETLITLPPPTNLVYPVAEATYATGQAIAPNTPTVEGFVQTWSVDPDLPAGLSLSPEDGTISGTPSAPSAQTVYTVTAGNAEGDTTAQVDIRVIDGLFAQFGLATNGGDSTLSTFTVDSDTGQLRHLSYAPTGGTPAAVAVTPNGRFVYTANAFENTISAFELDLETGALTPVGTTPTGTLPGGLVADDSGSYLYATCTSGADGVYALAIDGVTGALTSVPGSPFGAGTLPNDIAIHGDVVATCSANAANTIDTYLIDPGTGALSAVSSLPTGVSPRGLEFSYDGAFVYTGNQGDDTVSGYAVDAGGVLTELAQSPFDVAGAGGDGPEDVATAKGGFLYTANVANGTVTRFSIALDGALNPLGSTAVGTAATRAVTVDERGRHLYAVNEDTNEVRIYDIGIAGGLTEATPLGRVRARLGPNALSFASGEFPAKRFSDRAYVVAQNENRVYSYTINPSTGGVVEIDDDVSLPQPSGVTIHPAQDFVYITSLTFPGVGTYEVLGNGALQGVPPGVATDPGAWSTLWEPSGRFAYTTMASPTGGVQLLTRQPDGTVTAGATSAAGAFSRRAAIDPGGRFLYVPNEGADTISQFLIDDAGGGLVPLLPASVSASAGPIATAVEPSGRFLYGVASTGDLLDVYSIGVTGGLTPVTSVVLGGAGGVDLAVTPNGRFLYVLFEDTDELEIYEISPVTGIPAELGTGLSPVATDDEPVFVAVDASGSYLYVTNRGATSHVRPYVINPATGQLSPSIELDTGPDPREMTVNARIDLSSE